ncbi:family 20 glycosylhydrolase [Helcococcus sueciensis]
MGKKLRKILVLLMVFSLLIPNARYIKAQEFEGQNSTELISKTNPNIQKYIKDKSGKTWKLNDDTKFLILHNSRNNSSKNLKDIVKLANSELLEKELITKPLKMILSTEESVDSNTISINIDESLDINSDSNEAYKIVIKEGIVKVTGKSERAILYALRSIQNLSKTIGELPEGVIEDYPNVAERRIHLDMGRKYFSKEWIMQLIREMSYMKLNALQLHFSENKGFRIESEVDPEIVSDEHLTKDEVREIIEEAKKYEVEIIPSLDTPGHVDHILKVHPEYGQVDIYGNHYKSGLDVTNPEAVEYIKSLYTEYMELFEGSKHFHIGADEYMEFDRPPFTTIYKKVLDDYAKENLGPEYIWKDTLANYINEIAEHVYKGGFIPRVWNDGLYYGEHSYYESPQKVEMHSYIGVDFWSTMPWNRSIASLKTILDRGHDSIYNIHSGFFYYVLRPDKPNDGRNQASFDYLNADRRIYDQWTPGNFPETKVDDNSEFIKGASLAIWCDIPDLIGEDQVAKDIYNEMRALATKSWNTSSNSIQTFDEFKNVYEQLGHVAGYEKGSKLPEVGEFEISKDISKITVYYRNEEGEDLLDKDEYYGSFDKEVTINSKDVYGYKVVGDESVKEKFGKENKEYIFVYARHTDKTKLEEELNSILNEVDYLPDTFEEYSQKYKEAKTVLENDKATQTEVDKVYEELIEAKNNLIPIFAYPLYVEATYPLNEKEYISGYPEYRNKLDEIRNGIKGHDVSKETIDNYIEELNEAKNNLVKRNENTPLISANKSYYQNYNYGNMIDGDLNTKTWFDGNQMQGDTINFKFNNPVKLKSIRIVQPDDVGADALSNSDVEITVDGSNWEKVDTIKSNELDKTINLDEKLVKAVRIKITESREYWYQISEVIFNIIEENEDDPAAKLLEESKNISLEGKTIESASNFINKLLKLQEIISDSNNTYNQNDKEKAVLELKEAIENLVEKEPEQPKVNKEELQKTIELTLSVIEDVKDKFTEESVKSLESEIEKSNKVLEKEDATQEEVNEAVTKLKEAYKNLELKEEKEEIDTSVIEALIDKLNKSLEENSDKLTDESKENLENAIKSATELLKSEDLTQEKVDDEILKLVDAFASVKLKEEEKPVVDTTALSSLVEKANTRLEEDLEDESRENLENAIEKAKEIIAKEDLTQEEVNEAFSELVDALINSKVKVQEPKDPEEPEQPEEPKLHDTKGFITGTTNVRTSPNGPVIGTLEREAIVEGEYEEGSNWVKLDYYGQEAYVYKPLISDTIEVKGFASGDSNIRKSSNGEVIGLAKREEIVEGVVSIDNPNWIKTDKGYIYRPLVVDTIKVRGLMSGTTNVRMTPNGTLMGTLGKAEYVEGTLNITNLNWVRIRYQNRDGYVYRSLIVDTVSVSGTVTGTVNVRQTPNGKVLGTHRKGVKLTGKLSASNPNWVEIQYKGQRAYVYKEFVK